MRPAVPDQMPVGPTDPLPGPLAAPSGASAPQTSDRPGAAVEAPERPGKPSLRAAALAP